MAISMDFEIAAFQAAQLAFPGTQILGCFFHFVKNMKKHLTQEPDATRRYRNDADFSLHCKCVAAVAFVPLQRIDEAMAALQTHLPPECQFLLDWLEDNDVGKKNSTDYMYRHKHIPCEPDYLGNMVHALFPFRKVVADWGKILVVKFVSESAAGRPQREGCWYAARLFLSP